MVAETMCELLCRHGLMLAQLDQEGMPELDGGDEFQSTFQRVTLVLGQAYTAGTGTLHTTSRQAPGGLHSAFSRFHHCRQLISQACAALFAGIFSGVLEVVM